MKKIINPPIAWRYYIVYWRKPDGRTLYFRGTRRRELFIRDTRNDWVSEPERARLFELDKPTISDRSFAKALRDKQFRDQIHFCGFAGIVLASHLIIPDKTRRRVS